MAIESFLYDGVPVTPRSADALAKHYGYPTVIDLANGLPPEARVLDVGAGVSGLGGAVGVLKPDARWVNIDPAYNDPDIYRRAMVRTTPNVKLEPVNVQSLTEAFEPNTFDAVFSYWMLPYLAKEDPAAAHEAVIQMYIVAKFGGRIAIGPEEGRRREYDNAIQCTKNGSLDANIFANEVVGRIATAPRIYFSETPEGDNSCGTRRGSEES